MLYDKRFKGFNPNPKIDGLHAFLSPSQYHWLNYSDEKLVERLTVTEAAARGTSLHALAAHAIREGVELADNGSTLSCYVNDAIRLGLVAEQALFYSFNCYGTADAIGFEEDLMFLRVNDFKSGVSPTSFKQLYVYAALFCLEYQFRPFEINGELSIYQSEEIRVTEIDHNFLAWVHDRIVTFDRIIEEKRTRG